MTKKLNLQSFDVQKCEILVNPNDIRRDLHIYVDYMRNREVKRAYRSNDLPSADYKRLIKLMGHPEVSQANEFGGPSWLDYVDRLALELGWVDYDTKGEYVGYSSQSPSFPDNYIVFVQKSYEEFLTKSPSEQEVHLLTTLIQKGVRKKRDFDYDVNEFYSQSILGQLDSFPTWGAGTGVMPSLDFSAIRRFLFELLAQCEDGVWYSTASLIAYLKTNHPYFLIPQKPKPDRWGRKATRYGNFYESEERYRHKEDSIPDDAPDGFERVEGRYVERFLENIPLTLGYVDVAYTLKRGGGYPEKGRLKAFRIKRRFLHLMHGELPAPKVTVQPNFEVHIEAEFYPVGVINQLLTFAKVLTVDRVAIFKLDRQTAAVSLAEDDTLDPIAILQSLTTRALPQNVRIELEEWKGQADVFTLYTGFALWEGRKQAQMARFIVKYVSENMRIVRSPDVLFKELEQAELAPLSIKHKKNAFSLTPVAAKTLFPQLGTQQPAKRKAKERITLQREAHTTLHFPTEKALNRLSELLVTERCLFTSDKHSLTITYAQRYADQVKAAIKALREDYTVHVVDLKSS